MSARIIQLGLMSLIGSAIAVPVFPTGSFNDAGNSTDGEPAGPTGTGQAHGTGRHHSARPRSSGTGSLTMEAISTPEPTVAAANAVAVDNSTATSCSTETFYTTTTNILTVYVTPSAAASSIQANFTIPAGSAAPSSVETPVAPVASTSVATYSAPAAETPVASVSPVAQYVGQFSYSNNAAVAASSTPVATVEASPSVASPIQAAPATSTKVATSAVASTSTTSSVGGKRGIAYNLPDMAKLLIGKSQWAYNWGSSNGGLASGVEFLPMLWGAGTEKTGTWVKDATAGIAAGATALLGFNEPDHPEQANMSPDAAATAYKTHITDNFAGKAKLISPAVTNGGGSMGLTWLSSFMSACTDCKIDAVAIHWYDSSSNVDYFKSHILDAHTKTGLPVYLTEFGTTDGNDQAFLASVLPWLDSQDYVQKYAYFMASDGKLISGTSLSAAGNTYCA
ncbi:glycoside hydrolase family protein [Venturia nashicola]|nr:glycoside hydrolase family protein [Venturia nashicola]